LCLPPRFDPPKWNIKRDGHGEPATSRSLMIGAGRDASAVDQSAAEAPNLDNGIPSIRLPIF